MSDDDICHLSATAIVAAVRARELTATRVLENHLARTARLEPALNTYVTLDTEGALRAADRVDRAIAEGTDPGPLAGLPVSVKDLIAVGGLRQTFGSRLFKDNVAAADAPSVERLRRAGAVITGKTTTSELGSKAVGDSPLTGATRNPWNRQATPGGSSAGAAAGVAAGLVPAALGTDGGGSIRIPASFCGLVGFKASFGRVPVWPASATPSVAHVAPIARDVQDVALLLDVITGHDSRDPGSVPAPPMAASAQIGLPIRGLRIGWVSSLGYGTADSEIIGLCLAAARRLTDEGAMVAAMDRPLFDADPNGAWNEVFYGAIGARVRQQAGDDIAQADIDEALKRVLLQRGPDRPPEEVARLRADGVRQVEEAFTRFDVLAMPTMPVTAPPLGVDVPGGHEGRNPVDWSYFTYPFNLSGNPAVSMPVGLASNGMPFGLQLVAARGNDETLIAVASAFERINRFRDRPSIA
ncbi:amidase [Ramlibacter sp.]|uniref:amidase n=1 Tax=Ramlibacter sp. TaxID=1917967 RepID=UPI0035B2D837